jgi:hypothetical protein
MSMATAKSEEEENECDTSVAKLRVSLTFLQVLIFVLINNKDELQSPGAALSSVKLLAIVAIRLGFVFTSSPA